MEFGGVERNLIRECSKKIEKWEILFIFFFYFPLVFE